MYAKQVCNQRLEGPNILRRKRSVVNHDAEPRRLRPFPPARVAVEAQTSTARPEPAVEVQTSSSSAQQPQDIVEAHQMGNSSAGPWSTELGGRLQPKLIVVHKPADLDEAAVSALRALDSLADQAQTSTLPSANTSKRMRTSGCMSPRYLPCHWFCMCPVSLGKSLLVGHAMISHKLVCADDTPPASPASLGASPCSQAATPAVLNTPISMMPSSPLIMPEMSLVLPPAASTTPELIKSTSLQRVEAPLPGMVFKCCVASALAMKRHRSILYRAKYITTFTALQRAAGTDVRSSSRQIGPLSRLVNRMLYIHEYRDTSCAQIPSHYSILLGDGR